jgi:hypothetical protein
MATLKNIEDQRVRLRLTRIALMNGVDSIRRWADLIGVTAQVWSNAENSQNGVPVRVAKKIKDRFQVSMDWTIDADMSGLTDDFLAKLAKFSKEENVKKPLRQAS